MGRIVGQKLSELLGQQVVIENRGGAGGMIGTRDIAKSAPDGYTLGMILTGISLSPNAGYDIEKDFAPIGIVASTPVIVESNPSLPVKTLTDVITLAKKEPGKYSIGTPPAPPRFSMTTCWPRSAESFCPTMRPMASTPPPGG